MGLEYVDIGYRIEKAFDVELSIDDFALIVVDRDIVVGDLYDLLLERMHLQDVARSSYGLNYELWLQVQQSIHVATSTPLQRIGMSTRLETLFPLRTRRAMWNDLREVCPYRIRELDYPFVVRVFGFALAVAMVVVEQLQLWQLPWVAWLGPVLGILGIWMVGETYLKLLSIFAPLRRRFPPGMTTVKDLCRAVLASNYVDLTREVELPADPHCPEVWQKLCDVLVAVLGVDPDEITFRSRLVRDLGMQ